MNKLELHVNRVVTSLPQCSDYVFTFLCGWRGTLRNLDDKSIWRMLFNAEITDRSERSGVGVASVFVEEVNDSQTSYTSPVRKDDEVQSAAFKRLDEFKAPSATALPRGRPAHIASVVPDEGHCVVVQIRSYNPAQTILVSPYWHILQKRPLHCHVIPVAALALMGFHTSVIASIVVKDRRIKTCLDD
ncbi:MAG: hypothetical protein M0R22_06150 [Dehalococcoidia bacterium]|nr:hypothetical protein [Dehalococcoidia bacterium]